MNKERIGNEQYLNPVFKFGIEEHIKNLLTLGQVYLPTLHEFRDKDRYSGSVYDVAEGYFKIINTYSWYKGLAKDSNGIIPIIFPPYQHIEFENSTFEKEMSSNSANIYCVSQNFFSTTLNWALSQGKTSCALIVDFEQFSNIITQHLIPEYSFVNSGHCIYEGRYIEELDPTIFSKSNRFLTKGDRLFFSKPESYKGQNEIRSVWILNTNGEKVSESSPKQLEIPALRSFVFPISFNGINEKTISDFRSGVGAIGAHIHKRDGISSTLICNTPNDIFSPICYLSKNAWKIGLRYLGTSHTYKNAYFKFHEEMFIGSKGPIFCTCDLADLALIEYFYVTEWPQVLHQPNH